MPEEAERILKKSILFSYISVRRTGEIESDRWNDEDNRESD